MINNYSENALKNIFKVFAPLSRYKKNKRDIKWSDIKCNDWWIAIYNVIYNDVERISRISKNFFVSQNFVCEKKILGKAGALKRISRYHGTIRNSMNNNVLIYLPVFKKKTSFRPMEIFLKTEIFASVASPNSFFPVISKTRSF